MAEEGYVYQGGVTVGDFAPVVYFNKVQQGKEEKLDVWSASIAKDEDEEAKVWTDVANNCEEFCQGLLFGIMANEGVVNALVDEDAAKRIFGPKQIARNVAPALIKSDNKAVMDFGNLENCEVMIDYIHNVKPIKQESKGHAKTRGASGGGNGGPVGPRAPARHFNTCVVQKAGAVTQVPMSNMVEDVVFFTAAAGTKFRQEQESAAMVDAIEGVSRLIPEEYRNVKHKTESAKKQHRVRMIIQVTQHDGKEDDEGEKVEADAIEPIQYVAPGVKRTFLKMMYYVTKEQLIRVNIQNTTHLPHNAPPGKFEIQPIYETCDGDMEREEKIDFAAGETCELPYPIQKKAGEEPDAWLLCCAGTDIPIAKLIFKLDVVEEMNDKEEDKDKDKDKDEDMPHILSACGNSVDLVFPARK